MKTLNQLITSIETKANLDEYSVISKEDLQHILRCLKAYQNLVKPEEQDKISLNSADERRIP